MYISPQMFQDADIEVRGVFSGYLPELKIDSRKIKKDDLFWALEGNNQDGHNYVLQAFAAGASVAAVNKEWAEYYTGEGTLLIMKNTLFGLQNLARVVRENLGAIVIAVTGSHGKTTCKEMINAGIKSSAKVACTPGNYNNDIGLPISILNSAGDEKFLVLEMGANHPGEIDFLCQIAQPDIGLITAISEAHLEGFGSIEGVQKAKGELFNFLSNKGMAIVNLDDDRVLQSSHKNRLKVGFTLKDIPSDWKWSTYFGQVTEIDSWSRPTLEIEGLSVKLQFPGRHFANDALGAYAVCLEAGIEPENIIKSLGQLKPLPGRGQIINIGEGIEILDESYNANATTMDSALETLGRRPGYKIALLGDMRELGVYEEEEHRRIGRSPTLDLIDRVIFVGPRMAWAAEEAELSGHPGIEYWNEIQPEELAREIKDQIPAGSGIVVKASRAMQLDKFAYTLRNLSMK